jgi:hypothetical protein
MLWHSFVGIIGGKVDGSRLCDKIQFQDAKQVSAVVRLRNTVAVCPRQEEEAAYNKTAKSKFKKWKEILTKSGLIAS